MKRFDYYVGIVLLGLILVLGDGGLRWLAAADTAPEAPKVITAQEFRLVDAAGKPRGALRMAQGTMPSLILQNADGKVVATVGVSANGEPHFMLIDANGKSRADLSLSEKGGPAFLMLDPTGMARYAINGDTRGNNVSTLYRDANGTARLAMTLDDKDSHGWIAFTAPDGKTMRLIKEDGDIKRNPDKPATLKTP